MPRPETPPLTRAIVVRGLGFGLAIALGAVAVWLIVTGSMSPRRIEVGVLAGLWGLLLGAYTMFGARRNLGETLHYVTPAELAVRSGAGLEPAAQAEARRAFEERLEHLLRTEISSSVNREVGDLRREVALLRQELLEKVGGELRLERIETTRLIGSDLEALQHEVRALKTARDSAGINGTRPAGSSAIPVSAERVDVAEQAARERAAYEKASRERAEREQAERERAQREKAEREKAEREQAERKRLKRAKADAARVEQERLASERAAAQRAAREQAAREQAAREQAAREQAAREQAAREQAAREQAAREQAATQRPSSASVASDDPFASLPRITPFTDFELDPIETSAPSGGHSDDGPSYTGRRRANGAEVEDTGRHSRHPGIADTDDIDNTNAGHRHRADDDGDASGIDLLSQLLSRGPADR